MQQQLKFQAAVIDRLQQQAAEAEIRQTESESTTDHHSSARYPKYADQHDIENLPQSAESVRSTGHDGI